MSSLFPFDPEYESYEFLGKSDDEYFRDYVHQTPIATERLDTILKDFFSQGFNDGFFQGLQQGFAEGRDSKACEIVRNMLSLNMFTIEQIVQATKVPLHEVLTIQKCLPGSRTSGSKEQ